MSPTWDFCTTGISSEPEPSCSAFAHPTGDASRKTLISPLPCHLSFSVERTLSEVTLRNTETRLSILLPPFSHPVLTVLPLSLNPPGGQPAPLPVPVAALRPAAAGALQHSPVSVSSSQEGCGQGAGCRGRHCCCQSWASRPADPGQGSALPARQRRCLGAAQPPAGLQGAAARPCTKPCLCRERPLPNQLTELPDAPGGQTRGNYVLQCRVCINYSLS